MASARPRSSDPFDFPPDIVPKGMVYQWCAKTVLNEPNPSFQRMLEGGWTPVPAHRHRATFITKVDADGNVAYGGQVLMCRLAEVSQEAHALNEDAAHRNAAANARLIRFADIPFRLSKSEMDGARVIGMSCRQYALYRLRAVADGLDDETVVVGYRGPDSYGIPGALCFTRRRKPRHRWLAWLFDLISTEA